MPIDYSKIPYRRDLCDQNLKNVFANAANTGKNILFKPNAVEDYHEGYGNNSRSACYVPVGLVSIATYCKNQFPKAEVEILDGELISVEEIISELKPGAFVGIETKLLNYESALKIAQEAKKRACVVILGGVFASALSEVIMKNQSRIVDFVVVGFLTIFRIQHR